VCLEACWLGKNRGFYFPEPYCWRERENGEKQSGGDRREDDMRERGGTGRGEKEVGGGRKWTGG